MSSLQQALQKLDSAVSRVEGSVVDVEKAMDGKQRDMFSSPSNENGLADRAILAKRLDQTIEKVERLLQEAQG